DQGGLAAARIAAAAAPGVDERTAGGFCHAQPGGQAAVAQIAADGGRGAAGADAADDPRRLRVRFGGQLADDGFGDVVVAPPVGGGDREAELVEVAGAIGGVPVGA